MVKFIVLGKEYDSRNVQFTIGHLSDLWIDDIKGPSLLLDKDELEFKKMNECNTILPGFPFEGKDSRLKKKQVFSSFAKEHSILNSVFHDD